MNISTLIVSPENTEARDEALRICKINKIDEFDITYLEVKEDAASIGIKDVKEILQKIYLRPLKSPAKAIVLPNAELLTTEAQNSLLKILEEPPESTIIFLLTPSIDELIPTIRSRCKIIYLTPKNPTEPEREALDSFNSLKSLTTAQALELAEKFAKKKEDAPRELQKLLIAGKHLMHKEVNSKSPTTHDTALILSSLISSHKNLSNTNINTRLELEHLFLSLTTTSDDN